MRKSLLALAAIILCSLPSCTYTIKMDEPTQKRIDAATAEVKRLNDELVTFQKDMQALVAEIEKLRNAFGPRK
jgi:peptidoglycan hydrolase CwlO-like protein